MVEYALLVALIAVISIPAIMMVGDHSKRQFETVAQGFETPATDVSSDSVDEGNATDDGTGGGDESGTDTGTTTDTTTETDTGSEVDDTNGGGGELDGQLDGASQDQADDTSDDQTSDDQAGSSDQDAQTDETPAPGSTVASTSSSSDYYWWNSSRNGGEGAWKASVTFQNDWKRHQYLTVEVTKTDEKGHQTTQTITNFYVPAGGDSALVIWDNDMSVHGKSIKGVTSVEVTVTSITTSDEDWNTEKFDTDGPTVTVDSPETP